MPFSYQFDSDNGLDRVKGDSLSLTVKRLGAEAIGLTRHHDTHGDIALLWRNDQTSDPEKFWKSHATILFPIVGGLIDNKSEAEDKTPVRFNKQHGFARESEFELVEAADNGDHFLLHYNLADSRATLEMYPWRFSLDIFYRLFGDRLEQTMTVSNRDERLMPFQIGWHPGFNTPFLKGTKDACLLTLPEGTATQLENDDDCFLTGRYRDIELSGPFSFNDKELDRTYMFDFSATPAEERIVTLTDPDEKVGVKVHFAGYPHLGLWSDDGAPFLCIEPWQGMDDSAEQEPFNRKFGIVLLPPGTQDTRWAAIEMIG